VWHSCRGYQCNSIGSSLVISLNEDVHSIYTSPVTKIELLEFP
jgi:hypothetical protein